MEQKEKDPREGQFMVKTPQCGSKFPQPDVTEAKALTGEKRRNIQDT